MMSGSYRCNPLVQEIVRKCEAKYHAFDYASMEMERELTFYPDLLKETLEKIEKRVVEENDNPRDVSFSFDVRIFWPEKFNRKVEYYNRLPFLFDDKLVRTLNEKHITLLTHNVGCVRDAWNQKHLALRAGLSVGLGKIPFILFRDAY